MLLIKQAGFSLLQRGIERRMQELKNRRRVNAEATVVVDKWIQENFARQGVPAMGGSGWRPLSARTLAGRRKGEARRSSRILIDTGALKSRWKHQWDVNLAKVQSGVDYADEHHYGKFGLPVRRIIPLERQIWPLLQKLYKKYIVRVLK